ncbi:MAG: MerR family DNA-binding transcriptional regulator [Actinomycetota bacterium]|nr:MerR family DNA-binding transcriptional regulator [Actinomycetota bacterium]MDQ3351565.1 MerR family DNA-binding transcriptional regulator [Actinomycetota bacterium]
MSSYTIGDIARRSGFSASALRYYEAIGLVEPSGRTDAGYRLYDGEALTRLAFIARAKQLGCSLEEVTDLAGIWDGQQCGPVQRRFHALVTAKIRDADAQIGELTAFAEQLRNAAKQLDAEPVDGPCGAGCACVTGDGGATAGERSPVPIACTLEAGSMPDRIAAWHAVLATATDRVEVDGGLRIEFGHEVDVGELGRLAAAEQQCCAFFSFLLTVDAAGVALEVRAPELGAAMLTALFGP